MPIVPNAMPSAQPQMVTVGDRLLAVFQTDDLDRSDLNRTTLCYSVREDGVWSEPTPVWDNGAPDGSAALASDGQSAWLVWQKADRALSVPAAATESEMIDALSSAQEIAVARWDDAADGFVGSTYITDNETLDLLPAATVEGGSAHVAWVNNSSSDVFGRSGLNTVRSAVPSAGRWSVVDVGATTAPVLELAAGTVAGAPVFAYTIDKDGDLNTATDIELVLANMSARYTLSDNAVAETGPRFHDGRLYWYDGTLRSCDPATRIASPVFGEDAPLGAAYSLVSDGSRDGVVWLSSEPETGTAVCARWFEGPDSDQSFEITRTQKRIDVIVPDYSPTEGWGLLANLGVEDSSSIAYASVSPRPDMVLEGVSVDPDSRTAQGLTVELSLRNAGQTAASDLVLQVEEQGSGTKLAPIALTSSLEAGASGVETVRVPLPVLHDETDYAFEVVCAEDAYAADNTVVETLGKVDLALDVKHYVLGDQAVIVSHVLNNSSTETSAVLEIREDGESGAVVATQDIPSVGNSMGQVFTAVVPLFTESSESSPAPLAYVVEVRSAADEIVSGNNVALLTAEQLGGVPYDGEVTVTAPVQVEGISITNTPEGSVFDAQDIGSTHALSYETVPALASNQTVTWESSDSSVATVDANGVVTIQGSGTSTVTVTSADGSSTDTFEIKVFSAAVHTIEFMSAREVVGHADFADGEFLGSLPILERIGYTHAGWSREEGGAAIDSASYRVLASGPLYAVWAADSSAIVDSPGVMCPATVFDGTARASWGPVAGATSYEWRLNFASDWAPVLDRAVTVGGLASGPNIIEVRGVSDAGVGPAGFATVNALAVERVAGNDRYGTAAALARKGWDPTGSLAWSGVEHIIIANGEPGKESDPLSAAGLAGIYDAPVLTVQAKKLPSATKTVITEIAKKNPGVRIHIVGGESVVPVARWNDIKRIPGVSQVKDQFAGRDRFETSALMATRMVAVAGADAIKGVILIAGDNPAAFYDALAASPIACAQTMPMLSVQKTKIPTSVKNVLKTAALKDKPRYAASSATYIGSVPAAGALRMTTTSNRYTAATQITKFAAIDRDWTSRADTALASKLPDALTGGAFLGRVGGIMLFTDSAGSIQSTSEAFITGNKDGIVNGWVIGGTSVVPKAQETSFRNLLN